MVFPQFLKNLVYLMESVHLFLSKLLNEYLCVNRFIDILRYKLVNKTKEIVKSLYIEKHSPQCTQLKIISLKQFRRWFPNRKIDKLKSVFRFEIQFFNVTHIYPDFLNEYFYFYALAYCSFHIIRILNTGEHIII